jgi:antitoxin VapB
MRQTAKLFRHRRSQAVQLPKEFRFKGREVFATKVGDRVILEPVRPAAAMPWDDIDRLGERPFMPEGREQPAINADRAIFEDEDRSSEP